MTIKVDDHFILVDKCAEQTRIVEILNNKIVKFIAWFDSKPPLIGRIYDAVIIKKLNGKNIKLNIKAVYKAKQTEKILKLINKKTKVIISIFAGRMADKGKDPLPIFKRSISLTKKSKNIEILWASTREAYNYIQAKQINCNIITMPPKVINQISGFGKSFKSMTLDTVKGFLTDSKKSRFSL